MLSLRPRGSVIVVGRRWLASSSSSSSSSLRVAASASVCTNVVIARRASVCTNATVAASRSPPLRSQQPTFQHRYQLWLASSTSFSTSKPTPPSPVANVTITRDALAADLLENLATTPNPRARMISLPSYVQLCCSRSTADADVVLNYTSRAAAVADGCALATALFDAVGSRYVGDSGDMVASVAGVLVNTAQQLVTVWLTVAEDGHTVALDADQMDDEVWLPSSTDINKSGGGVEALLVDAMAAYIYARHIAAVHDVDVSRGGVSVGSNGAAVVTVTLRTPNDHTHSIDGDNTAAVAVDEDVSDSVIADTLLTSNDTVDVDAVDGVDVDDGEDAQLVADIIDTLERQCRPHIVADGGDVEFVRYERGSTGAGAVDSTDVGDGDSGRGGGGTVYLRMFGACTSCPSSTVTAKFMIGNLLRHYYPDDVTDVVRVDDDGDVELGVDGRPLL